MEKFNPEWAKDVPCRNVIIYGFCKKQKEGCPFKHDNDPAGTEAAGASVASASGSAGEVHTTASSTVHSDAMTNPNTVQLNGSLMPSLPSLASLSKRSTAPSVAPTTPAAAAPLGHKFNAKNSETFTPGSSQGQTSAASGNAMDLAGPPKLGKSYSQSFTPSFDAYASESFTPTSVRANPMEQMDSGFAGMNIGGPLNAPVGPGNAGMMSQGLAIPPGSLPAQSLPQSAQSMQAQQGQPQSQTQSQQAQGLSGSGPMFPVPMPGPNAAMNPARFPSIYPPPHSILQYHLYAPDPPPHLQLPLKPNERTPEMLFIPNDIREELVKRNLEALQNFPPGGALPDVVQDYYGLIPLDFHKKSAERNRYKDHQNSLYKVFSNTDGKIYVLRRIHAIMDPIEPPQIAKTFKKWNALQSTNVVHLHDCFLTTAFGDSSLCFVYDYYPRAWSLYETHFTNFPLVPITQDLLWVYLIQLTNALREVHARNLVVRNFDWEKVLVTGSPGRIKVSSCNEVEPLVYGQELAYDEIGPQQQQDYARMGDLLYKLAAGIQSSGPVAAGVASVENVDQLNVEDKFKDVLRYLLSPENTAKTVNELSVLFVDKIYLVYEALNTYTEKMEGVLSRELENGRLFRLMCKLNFIFGRVESRIDINWSESGEKFPIILFYDYVFHQVDAQGKAVMDLTHVLRCLNKLDAGVNEKLVLATPDEMNCIIISYKELKDLISTTFRALTQ